MVQNGVFWTKWEQTYIFFPIISYQKIKFHRVEKMDIGISHWNNGVCGTVLISISTMVLIVQYKIFW